MPYPSFWDNLLKYLCQLLLLPTEDKLRKITLPFNFNKFHSHCGAWAYHPNATERLTLLRTIDLHFLWGNLEFSILGVAKFHAAVINRMKSISSFCFALICGMFSFFLRCRLRTSELKLISLRILSG